jgi:hypothetical protein
MFNALWGWLTCPPQKLYTPKIEVRPNDTYSSRRTAGRRGSGLQKNRLVYQSKQVLRSLMSAGSTADVTYYRLECQVLRHGSE